MKFIATFVFFCTAIVWAQIDTRTTQQILPKLGDDDQVCVFDDGTPLTAGQLRGFATALDPGKQLMAVQSPESLINEIAFMHKLASLAEKEKLDQQSPAREQLAFNRMLFLTQMKAADALTKTEVDPKEILTYYNLNRNKYKQVKVNAIYI